MYDPALDFATMIFAVFVALGLCAAIPDALSRIKRFIYGEKRTNKHDRRIRHEFLITSAFGSDDSPYDQERDLR